MRVPKAPGGCSTPKGVSMTTNTLHESVRDSAAALLGAERDIERALKRYQDSGAAQGAVAEALQAAGELARAHQDALQAFLSGQREGATTGEARIPLPIIPEAAPAAHGTAGALQAAQAVLASAAASYAGLYALALRLYAPPLRKLAPKHLQDYAQAARSVAGLIPAAVSQALMEHENLDCSCICPMCGIGACG